MYRYREREEHHGIIAANVVRKALPEHVYGCKLMNGRTVYYRQEQPTEIRLERHGKISNPLPPLPIRFAGELDNLVFFYTQCDKTATYSFYMFWWDETQVPAEIGFKKIGQIPTVKTGKKIQFALQQPYFIDFTDDAITINKFGSGVERTLSRETSGVVRGFGSFIFFVWRGLAVMVREAVEGECTSVTDDVFYDGEICVIAIELGIPPASSVYAQRGSFLYLLCGATLFVFNEDFSYYSYRMERPECRIGGAETRRLFLNANKLFFSHDLPELFCALEKQESKRVELHALSETYKRLSTVQYDHNGNIADYHSRFERDFSVENILGIGGGVKDKRGSRVVFAAVSNEDDVKYAVKRIAFDPSTPGLYDTTQHGHQTDGELLERLPQHSQRWEMLNYPQNCAFIYMQMQLAKGDLTIWLSTHRTYESRPFRKMRHFFKQMVSAVGYLHQKNLIHRDLKPGNVLLFDGDVLKLCDMGIAINQENREEQSHTGSGTTPYMSPEQNCAFPQLNSMTDIFTLGLILTELCIVLDNREKYIMFDNFRRGAQNRLNGLDEETALMVNRLTKLNKNERPSCRQILEDPYLA